MKQDNPKYFFYYLTFAILVFLVSALILGGSYYWYGISSESIPFKRSIVLLALVVLYFTLKLIFKLFNIKLPEE
ncbi:MAG: hypothetical protein KDI76_13150 [Xanthomonadales bacterium]|nr:hypothetical protein [Xanthomonadales bacterium]